MIWSAEVRGTESFEGVGLFDRAKQAHDAGRIGVSTQMIK